MIVGVCVASMMAKSHGRSYTMLWLQTCLRLLSNLAKLGFEFIYKKNPFFSSFFSVSFFVLFFFFLFCSFLNHNICHFSVPVSAPVSCAFGLGEILDESQVGWQQTKLWFFIFLLIQPQLLQTPDQKMCTRACKLLNFPKTVLSKLVTSFTTMVELNCLDDKGAWRNMWLDKTCDQSQHRITAQSG